VKVGDAERAAYEAAFAVLKAGQYDASARQFADFLQQFRSLLERFPAHDKAAGAMLKLGLSQYGLGQQDAAEATLAQVVRSYPGTDAARTAQDRLQAMRLTSAR
jgi:TolA-binding protein